MGRLEYNGMARETGLEPAASAVTGRRSNQLSYSRNSMRLHRLTSASPGVQYGLPPTKSR